MPKKFPTRLACFALMATLALSLSVSADDTTTPPVTGPSCVDFTEDKVLSTERASIGFLMNVADHPKSVRSVAERLLTAALADSMAAARTACVEDCGGSPAVSVVYKVAPFKFLPDEKQKPICLQFEQETANSPMPFGAVDFESIEKMNDWIMNFTQGKGDAGKKLYAQCSENCSPRYTFFIKRKDSGYSLSTEVLCGRARDKGEDNYDVSTAVRLECSVSGDNAG